ncbi:MAG: MFS transporter, partial [Pseudomonadota bacterium]
NLLAGAAGFVGYHLFGSQYGLLIPMVGLGMAWGSILALPYAILADALPVRKMGIYMGIFNFFIVLPQIVVSGVMGPILREFLGGNAIYAVMIGGVSLALGAVAVLFVNPTRQLSAQAAPVAAE